jgi:hypothetical protein
MRKFAILYGVWFALIFTGGGVASWWYRRHGADA